MHDELSSYISDLVDHTQPLIGREAEKAILVLDLPPLRVLEKDGSWHERLDRALVAAAEDGKIFFLNRMHDRPGGISPVAPIHVTDLNSTSTREHMRDVVADMARQNLGAPLNVGVPITNESPKMCKGDDFMSQCPIDITDSGLVRFQIQNHDRPETVWHTSVLDQFRCRHSLSPALAGTPRNKIGVSVSPIFSAIAM